MEALNTGLLIGLIGFGAGVALTLVLVLLLVIYHNTIGCTTEKEEDKDDSNSFIIPMSQLHNPGMPGGYSQQDIARAAAAIRAATGTAKPEEAKEATTGGYA